MLVSNVTCVFFCQFQGDLSKWGQGDKTANAGKDSNPKIPPPLVLKVDQGGYFGSIFLV